MNLAINDHRLTKPGSQNAALRDYDSKSISWRTPLRMSVRPSIAGPQHSTCRRLGSRQSDQIRCCEYIETGLADGPLAGLTA
jgi:hypothetical protein